MLIFELSKQQPIISSLFFELCKHKPTAILYPKLIVWLLVNSSKINEEMLDHLEILSIKQFKNWNVINIVKEVY